MKFQGRQAALIVGAALLVACQTEVVSSPPPMQVRSELSFEDSDAFDAALASALSRRPNVVHVALVEAVQLEKIPPRLSAWLAEVQTANGIVRRIDPISLSRGSPRRGVSPNQLVDVIDNSLTMTQLEQRIKRLRLVDDYDATIVFNESPQRVKAIVFVRRH